MVIYCKKSYLKVKKKEGKGYLTFNGYHGYWHFHSCMDILAHVKNSHLGPADGGWEHHFHHKGTKQGPAR